MSKRKDPKDEAIAYVLNQPLDVATAFVQTLAAVVKARGANMAAGKPKSSSTTSPRRTAPAANAAAATTTPAPPKGPTTPPLNLGEHPPTH